MIMTDGSTSWYADMNLINHYPIMQAAEAVQLPVDNAGKVFLFRNNHDGTFKMFLQKLD